MNINILSMETLVKHTRVDSGENRFDRNSDESELFEKISIREWILWDSKDFTEKVYEDSKMMKKLKLKNGL